MYKYTYILSESYRQNTPFVNICLPQHRPPPLNNPTSHAHITHLRPKIHSTVSNQNSNHQLNHNFTQPAKNQNLRRTKMAVSVPKFNYEIDNPKLMQSHKTFINQSQENQHENYHVASQLKNYHVASQLKNYHVANDLKTQSLLNNNFVKLNNLGQRNSEALREVQLQNKFKAISVKYKEQQPDNSIRDSLYKKYKHGKQTLHNQNKVNLKGELDNQKQSLSQKTIKNDYSFNTLPQPPKIQIQQQKINLPYEYSYNQPIHQTRPSTFYGNENEMGINRKQVKNMISHHLLTAKYDRQQQKLTHKLEPSSFKQAATRDRESKMLSDTQNYFNSPNQQQKGKLAVQKLSSLQQKIKSSIKPYLNI